MINAEAPFENVLMRLGPPPPTRATRARTARGLPRNCLAAAGFISAVLVASALAAPSPAPTAPAKTASLQIEDLGTPMKSSIARQTYLFQDPTTRHYRVLLFFQALSDKNAKMADVDLDTKEVYVLDVPGYPSPYRGTLLHSNGKIYTGCAAGNVIWSYDPKTRQVASLFKTADRDNYTLIEGPDGDLFAGGTPNGYVERCDIKSGKVENFGIVDDPGPPRYRYVYTLGADKRYIYAGMGQNPWYLVVIDKQTKKSRAFWKDENRNLPVAKGADGFWYAGSCRLVDGEPVALPATEKKPVMLTSEQTAGLLGRLGEGQDTLAAVRRHGLELDLAEAVADSGNDGRAKLRWRKTGAAEWDEAAFSIPIVPTPVKRLYSTPDGRLLGFTEAYNPLFLFDPASGKTTLLGRSQRSLYDALLVNGQWFFCGYPSSTLQWDPAKPWSLTQSAGDLRAPGVNPRLLNLPGGKYHWFQAADSQGVVWTGMHHERDSTGGSMTWYDPATGKSGNIRDPFVKFDVRDVTAADQGGPFDVAQGRPEGTRMGGKIVVSTVSIEKGQQAFIFVIDAKERKLAAKYPVAPWATHTGKIQEVEDNVIVGVTDKDQGFHVYKMDLRDGRLLYDKEETGKLFGNIRSYDRRLTRGPDGGLWLYVDDTICRINPADGTLKRVMPAKPAGGLVFVGKDLYIYGPPEIRRIKGICD